MRAGQPVSPSPMRSRGFCRPTSTLRLFDPTDPLLRLLNSLRATSSSASSCPSQPFLKEEPALACLFGLVVLRASSGHACSAEARRFAASFPRSVPPHQIAQQTTLCLLQISSGSIRRGAFSIQSPDTACRTATIALGGTGRRASHSRPSSSRRATSPGKSLRRFRRGSSASLDFERLSEDQL